MPFAAMKPTAEPRRGSVVSDRRPVVDAVGGIDAVERLNRRRDVEFEESGSTPPFNVL